MLQTRGFEVPDAKILDMTQEEFDDYFQGKISKLTTQITKPEPLMVWYIETTEKDVPIADIRQFFAFITDERGQTPVFKHSIIISDQKLGSDAIKNINEMPAFRIEHFRFDQLSYNPLEHFLAVQHVRLSKQETKAFYAANHYIVPSQLPTLLSTDPVARYYDFQPGDLIEIHRYLPESISYRIVVRGPRK